MTALVDDRSLRTRATERRSRCEDELKIFVGFFVAQDALGDLQEPAEFDQRGDAGTGRGLKGLVARPAKAQCPKTGLVGDAEQIVGFGEGTNGTPVALRSTALGALHQPTAPSIRR